MNNGLELARLVLSGDRHKISLREARLNVRMDFKTAANIAGVTERTIKKWEMDCGKTDLFIFNKLCKAYKISSAHVYAGKEADLLEARREASELEKKTFEVNDLITVMKQMGRDTTELENFVEEVRKSREAETKNRPNAVTLASAR